MGSPTHPTSSGAVCCPKRPNVRSDPGDLATRDPLGHSHQAPLRSISNVGNKQAAAAPAGSVAQPSCVSPSMRPNSAAALTSDTTADHSLKRARESDAQQSAATAPSAHCTARTNPAAASERTATPNGADANYTIAPALRRRCPIYLGTRHGVPIFVELSAAAPAQPLALCTRQEFTSALKCLSGKYTETAPDPFMLDSAGAMVFRPVDKQLKALGRAHVAQNELLWCFDQQHAHARARAMERAHEEARARPLPLARPVAVMPLRGDRAGGKPKPFSMWVPPAQDGPPPVDCMAKFMHKLPVVDVTSPAMRAPRPLPGWQAGWRAEEAAMYAELERMNAIAILTQDFCDMRGLCLPKEDACREARPIWHTASNALKGLATFLGRLLATD